MAEPYSNTETALIVADVPIPEDADGRFNLNVLHQASGDESKRPSDWLRRKSTKALISELQSQVVNGHLDVVTTVHGGNASGTFAHQLLAVSYAGWISPTFQLKVNQAFLDMKEGRLIPASTTPVVHDPALKMLIDMALKLDESRHEVACIKEEQFRHTQALVAQQQQTIEALSVSHRAESKADMALEEAHRMTLEDFVLRHGNLRQFPYNKHAEYARWLGGFCQAHGFVVIKVDVVDRPWEAENVYPIQALAAWLRYEQKRPRQITLVREDPLNHHKEK